MKKKTLVICTFSALFICSVGNGQSRLLIRNVTPNTTSTPTINVESIAASGSALADGIITTASGGSDNHGIKSIATGGTNYNVGVFAHADNAGVTGVGVLAMSTNARSSNYGIYANAAGGGTNWAGYFVGNVFATGNFQPSDLKLKRNVKTEESMLQKIMRLRPVSYEYKTDEYKFMNLPENNQHGFVAQELKAVFPEAVKAVQQPVFENNKLVKSEEFEAVNYQLLIPVLFKAIQEQQEMIATLQKEVNELKGRKITGAFMSDPMPNPSTLSTTIKYSVPSSIEKASIEVYDVAGKKILQYNNLKGSSQIVINSSELAAGTYVYTLLISGKAVQTNRFLVGKG